MPSYSWKVNLDKEFHKKLVMELMNGLLILEYVETANGKKIVEMLR